jgi:hypothetical protein
MECLAVRLPEWFGTLLKEAYRKSGYVQERPINVLKFTDAGIAFQTRISSFVDTDHLDNLLVWRELSTGWLVPHIVFNIFLM